ncbi:MAG: hypothetical protein CL949_14095 [Erythrobacter sp.]|mgnify:CR=1 FL=1|nr:hypothetical protein [Erythrobacter sp.]
MKIQIFAAFAATLMLCGCNSNPTEDADAANLDNETATFADSETALDEIELASPVAAEDAISAEPEEPSLTGPQYQATRSAQQYLSMTGFSREGLIEQLSSQHGEGYDRSDAIAAVDSLDVDWNENAARSARQYLEMTGFSCSGLIEQLSSSAGERYTRSEAEYGARQAGAC